MKRDMDLIRRILLAVESDDDAAWQDVDAKVLAFHVALLEEAGLIRA